MEDVKAGALGMLKTWAAFGYSSIVNLMGGTGIRMDWPEVFRELEKEGRLPLRVNFCYTLFNLGDLDEAVKYKGRDSELVRFAGGKIFVDGAYAGGQAWTSWENRQGGHGLAEIFTDDSGGPGLNLNRIVAKAEEYGLDMQYHAQGDLAIAAVLDALDAVRAKAGRVSGIHTLIHCAFPTDALIERMKSFGGHVVATMQPGFWPVEADTEYYYGDMALKAYPVRKMMDSGIVVGVSTDFSVSPPEYSPATVLIGVAATGGGYPDIHEPVGIGQMIEALSLGSAATTGKSDTGRLKAGFKADFSVFDEDMLALAPADFSALRPRLLAGYVGGKKVFQRK
jgi:predicted amidohydrolase YtcJ